jgi:glycosyltransferase involved in cell wall biosynthesis
MPQRPLHATVTVEQVWQRVPGGSGTYVTELTRALHARDDIDVTGLSARHTGPPPADWALDVPVRAVPVPRRALYDAWQVLRAPRAEWTVPRTDVVHATTWAVPPTSRPLVVTVHDLAFLHDETHFTARGNRFFRRALSTVRHRADAVLVPSQATADECAAAGIDAARLHVVPHGTHVLRPDAAAVAEWRRRVGVTNPYVLWCGTVEPRKNLATLLRAFARLEDPQLDLVLVGPPGWGDVPAHPAGLDASRVHVLGHLSRADLGAAYEGAAAFCFPSLREGFGLPVLEAMAHGVPVVTSAGTACAEVAGDAGLLVEPTDVDGLASALAQAVADDGRRAAASLARAEQFSWAEAARRTAAVYASVAAG